jgi:hypothetical protein
LVAGKVWIIEGFSDSNKDVAEWGQLTSVITSLVQQTNEDDDGTGVGQFCVLPT